MTYEHNVQLRRDAEGVMDLIGEREAHFWECLAEMARAKAGMTARPIGQPPPEGMGEREAARFEKTPWPYGGLSMGLPVGDVDPEWIARHVDGSDFDRRLRLYVATARFKARMDRSDPPPAHLRRR